MKTVVIFLLLVIVCSSAFAGGDSLSVMVQGDTVIVWDKQVKENCASRFQLSTSWLDSHLVVITETDTAISKAYCICTYDLSVVFTGLEAGHYAVSFHREYLVQYGYLHDTTITIGEIEFDIGASSPAAHSETFSQSSCYNMTPVEASRELTNRFELQYNYPNPFNPATTVKYILPVQSMVKLTVYNLLGQIVGTLVDAVEPAGEKIVRWDASQFASGVYYYRLDAASTANPLISFSQIRKMALVK